jgi:hypothetical protein
VAGGKTVGGDWRSNKNIYQKRKKISDDGAEQGFGDIIDCLSKFFGKEI